MYRGGIYVCIERERVGGEGHNFPLLSMRALKVIISRKSRSRLHYRTV
jgi:hypothetical protein